MNRVAMDSQMRRMNDEMLIDTLKRDLRQTVYSQGRIDWVTVITKLVQIIARVVIILRTGREVPGGGQLRSIIFKANGKINWLGILAKLGTVIQLICDLIDAE